jgi:TIR domain
MSKTPADDETSPTLDVLLVGESHELEMLRFKLDGHPSVGRATQVYQLHGAWGEVRGGPVIAVIVDLAGPHDDPDTIALSIFRMRQEYPELVFALLADEDEFTSEAAAMSSETRRRLGHYYRLPRQFEPADIERLVELFERWAASVGGPDRQTPRYQYDVALSFAGEEREQAEELATLLREAGVRVFFDTFEQAELWGRNLFDHLFNVYSEQSRYCIVFVSSAYAGKMWTGHERQAAQQRVLQDRNAEYLLPVRFDDTELPGLPMTVAYVDAAMGMARIAQLLVRKLGASMAVGERAEGDR